MQLDIKTAVARIQRILGTLRDPVSHRVLWCGLTNRLISVPNENSFRGREINLGWPSDEPSPSGARIPKIIFQPWTSRCELPVNYAYWRTSFVDKNPDYKFFFWDTSDNRCFIANRFPWFLNQYDKYPLEIFRTNITRLFFLYSYGGFSVHIDSECLKPLNEVSENSDVLVGRMGYNRTSEHSIPNAVMVSKPKQAFWLLTIAMAIERFAQSGDQIDARPEWLTGPVLLKNAVDFYLTHSKKYCLERIAKSCPELAIEVLGCDFGRLTIMPSETWCPIDWNNFVNAFLRKKMMEKRCVLPRSLATRLFPKSNIVTYWSEPWK